jgi:hypothetical protein
MRLRRFASLFVFAASVAGVSALAQSTPAPDAPAAPTYDLGDAKHLKVLYAGVPDTPRAKAFVDFLKANFEKVGELDVAQLSQQTAAPWDVVVCDGRRLYPMDPQKPSINQAKCNLGPEFTKPIVMIASMVSVQNHTKLGWL